MVILCYISYAILVVLCNFGVGKIIDYSQPERNLPASAKLVIQSADPVM